jgi:hypothetical protein
MKPMLYVRHGDDGGPRFRPCLEALGAIIGWAEQRA